MDRAIPLRRLREILRRYGIHEDPKRGKGSHTLFTREFEDGKYSYPIPTHGKDVLACYVRGCRKKFRLLPENGVTDEEFYG